MGMGGAFIALVGLVPIIGLIILAVILVRYSKLKK